MGTPKKSRGQSVKSSFLTVGTGEILGQVAVVARGTIIVRMIGLEEMGIVATILILVEFLNRMANLNPSITMVQDRHGASRGFRHTLQSILLLRGVLFFVVLSLLAWPLSVYYQQEPYLAGFFAVALIPLLSSMVHVDVWRQLKKREYKPQAILSATPKVGSLVVTAIACIWIQSFWLPIIARISGAVIVTFVSFKLAKRRFGLAFERDHVRRIVRFLVPLMGAGVLIYFSGQGTTFFIASGPTIFKTISVEQVTLVMGTLYVAMRFSALPDSIGSKLVQSTWSPRLAKAVDSPPHFRKIFVDMQSVAYMMAALAILILGAGTTWVTIIYGAGAALAGPVVTLLSIYSGLRLGRVAMRSAALSSGRSGLIFWANLASGCSVIVVVISMILVGKQEDKTAFLLTMLPVSMIIGELCSLLTLNTLLNRNGPLKLGFLNLWMRPVLICGTAILVAMIERHVISWYFDGSMVVETLSEAIIAGSISLGIAGLYIIVLAMMLGRTRQLILSMASRGRSR